MKRVILCDPGCCDIRENHFFLAEDHLKIAILEKIEEIERRLAPPSHGVKIHNQVRVVCTLD